MNLRTTVERLYSSHCTCLIMARSHIHDPRIENQLKMENNISASMAFCQDFGEPSAY